MARDSFTGLVDKGAVVRLAVLSRDGGLTPVDADSAPTYRVYGPAGVLSGGTGALGSFFDSGTLTGATNASPIVVTSVNHKLSSGTRVTISGVLGNTAANGTFTVTSTGTDTFSLNGSTGNGAYTSGGAWHVSGLYLLSLDTSAPAYETGVFYQVLVTYVVSGTTRAVLYSFQVV